MEKLFVKPANPDQLVRDPKTMLPLPKEGKFVEPSQFWFRRLRDGDCVGEADAKKEESKEEKQEETSSGSQADSSSAPKGKK